MAKVNPKLNTPEDIAFEMVRTIKELAARVAKADEKDLYNWAVAHHRSAQAVEAQAARLLLIVAKAA